MEKVIEKQEDLLKRWTNGIRLMNVGHYQAAKYYRRLHLILGIPVIILTTFIGTSLTFMTVSTQKSYLGALISSLSIVAAILAGLQTFLRFAEHAQRHHVAAVKYGELRREIQELLSFRLEDVDEIKESMEKIRRKWDLLEPEAHTLPDRFLKE